MSSNVIVTLSRMSVDFFPNYLKRQVVINYTSFIKFIFIFSITRKCKMYKEAMCKLFCMHLGAEWAVKYQIDVMESESETHTKMFTSGAPHVKTEHSVTTRGLALHVLWLKAHGELWPLGYTLWQSGSEGDIHCIVTCTMVRRCLTGITMLCKWCHYHLYRVVLI